MSDETKITVAKATDTECTFTLSKPGGLVAEPIVWTPTIYICPDHGEVNTGCVFFYGPNNQVEGEYCMECYKAHIRATCKPVTRKS